MESKYEKLLFIFGYCLIIYIFAGIYFTIDSTQDSYLIHHKTLFFITTLLVIWSHLQASLNDPGILTHENNLRFLEVYISTHQKQSVYLERINSDYKHLINQDKRQIEDLTDDEDDDLGYEYDLNSLIQDSSLNEICERFKIKLYRCSKCMVVRPPRARHCSKCKGCVLKHDHHCPWINNCIGMFNRKHFILFCLYSLIGTLHGMTIVLYYNIYKDSKNFWYNHLKITYSIFFFVFGIIFFIFSICLLIDQWNSIKEETIENFGEGLSAFWLLPVNRSKFYEYFKGRINEKEEGILNHFKKKFN